MQKIIVANWKMNGSSQSVADFCYNLSTASETDYKIVFSPPFPYLSLSKGHLTATNVQVFAQNVSEFNNGSYTGDVSAIMLKDIDCGGVIIGHIERRTLFKESDDTIKKKVQQAQQTELIPILCIGENAEQHQSGKTLDTIKRQLTLGLPSDVNVQNLWIAYEPVWAIGTGKTASIEDIAKVHTFIKEQIGTHVPVLYGGSVTPDNSKSILSNGCADGLLIGKTSLDWSSFSMILKK